MRAVVSGPDALPRRVKRISKEWFQAIVLGRQDALVALVLVLCKGAQSITLPFGVF